MFRFDIPRDALEIDTEGVVIADTMPQPWWKRWPIALIVAALASLSVLGCMVY
ncbi:MAG: hypothetical protein ACLFTT_04245 [Candidatus Hydrogenedentota bacterium]